MKPLSIAIVGGGFSGIAVAANLVKKSHRPLQIYLIEKSDHPGVAFSTENPAHPLNVRACQMSAFKEASQDFCEWLQNNQELWRKENSHFTRLQYTNESFLPRKLYGLYLKDLLEKTLERCGDREMQMSYLRDEVLDVELARGDTLKLITKANGSLKCDVIVLAMGIPPRKSLPFETASLLKDSRYLNNIWTPPPESVLKTLPKDKGRDLTILIVGSGLTMVDTIIGLVHMGYKGKFICISTSGKMPESHTEKMGSSAQPPDLKSKGSLLKIFKEVRQQLSSAFKAGTDWRYIIDAIRPQVLKIWKQLSEVEQKRFLRHLFSIWNKYRHRMSPESLSVIKNLEADDRLHFYVGQVEKIDPTNPSSLKVSANLKKVQRKISWDVDYVVNCTGPDYRVKKQNNPFLQSLEKKGLVRWDALELGLKTTEEGYLAGKFPGRFYALGNLLFGEFLETTAVPEIREQAAHIADKILSTKS